MNPVKLVRIWEKVSYKNISKGGFDPVCPSAAEKENRTWQCRIKPE